jgi:hypothetical protein
VAIYFRLIFRIKTPRIRMLLNYTPRISPATHFVFLPAARYANDPIFNIVFANRSPSFLPGEVPGQRKSLTTKTGYMTRGRGVKVSPDSRRGEI